VDSAWGMKRSKHTVNAAFAQAHFLLSLLLVLSLILEIYDRAAAIVTKLHVRG
jgi:hypothetical protein